MRVLCSTIDENDVEGEVIGGDSFDPITECGISNQRSPFGAMMGHSLRCVVGWWMSP